MAHRAVAIIVVRRPTPFYCTYTCIHYLTLHIHTVLTTALICERNSTFEPQSCNIYEEWRVDLAYSVVLPE